MSKGEQQVLCLCVTDMTEPFHLTHYIGTDDPVIFKMDDSYI